MYGVCLQTKPSKTVLSFMLDKSMNAYGVKLESHVYSSVKLTLKHFSFTQNFVRALSNSFEGYLEDAFKILVPDSITPLLSKCHEYR